MTIKSLHLALPAAMEVSILPPAELKKLYVCVRFSPPHAISLIEIITRRNCGFLFDWLEPIEPETKEVKWSCACWISHKWSSEAAVVELAQRRLAGRERENCRHRHDFMWPRRRPWTWWLLKQDETRMRVKQSAHHYRVRLIRTEPREDTSWMIFCWLLFTSVYERSWR